MLRATSTAARLAAGVTLVLAAATTTACGGGSDSGSGDKLKVVAAFYPLEFVARRVGGDRVSVANLTKPGAEPHDLELEPKQRKDISSAKLVVYLAGFHPAIDEAIQEDAGSRAFDVAAVEPLSDAPPGAAEEEPAKDGKKHANEGKDPHVWLDPTRLATISDKVADKLAAADSGYADEFRSRAAALRKDLEALDKEYATGLANCKRHEIVTSHAAFGYLTKRYKLEQIPITGISPETEPTPQRLAEVTALARQKGVTTIFFETLVSPKIAETIAKEVGAKAEVLDPIEGIEPDGKEDYMSVMRANLGRLRTALGCS